MKLEEQIERLQREINILRMYQDDLKQRLFVEMQLVQTFRAQVQDANRVIEEARAVNKAWYDSSPDAEYCGEVEALASAIKNYDTKYRL